MESLFLFALAVIAAEPKLDDLQRALIAKKFPDHDVVATCSARGLGKPGEAAVALFDKTGSRFRVLWMPVKGEPKELDTVSQSGAKTTFELSCMDPDEAAAHTQRLSSTDSIHSYLKLPKGSSMLCYFTDELSSKCWASEAKTNGMLEIGGWDT